MFMILNSTFSFEQKDSSGPLCVCLQPQMAALFQYFMLGWPLNGQGTKGHSKLISGAI